MVQPVDLWVREDWYDDPKASMYGMRLATDAEVIARLRQVEGVERVWRCEVHRGGESLCREVNSYEPSLHSTCGWTLVVPVPDSRKAGE